MPVSVVATGVPGDSGRLGAGSTSRTRNAASFLTRFWMASGVGRSSSRVPINESTSAQLGFFVLHMILRLFYVLMSVYHGVLYYYRRASLHLLMLFTYHNRTPQLIRSDIMSLDKVPRRVAVVLNLKEDDEEGGGIEGLLDQAGEIAAWCIGAGVHFLTVYEKSGVLKPLPLPDIERIVSRKIEAYFGNTNKPHVKIVDPRLKLVGEELSNGHATNGDKEYDLVIDMLSLEDGRSAIVELSRTLADMASKKQVKPEELSVELIDEHLSISTAEPDLVILFTPTIDLQGFPPWHIRLSEIFYLPDNNEVSYVVFLKALQKYSGCKINVGR